MFAFFFHTKSLKFNMYFYSYCITQFGLDAHFKCSIPPLADGYHIGHHRFRAS